MCHSVQICLGWHLLYSAKFGTEPQGLGSNNKRIVDQRHFLPFWSLQGFSFMWVIMLLARQIEGRVEVGYTEKVGRTWVNPSLQTPGLISPQFLRNQALANKWGKVHSGKNWHPRVGGAVRYPFDLYPNVCPSNFAPCLTFPRGFPDKSSFISVISTGYYNLNDTMFLFNLL